MKSFISNAITLFFITGAEASGAVTLSTELPDSVKTEARADVTDETYADTVAVVAAEEIAKSSPATVELTDTATNTRYDRRVYKYRRLWNFLIPTQSIIQYAGNMGMISTGIGWDYGNHRQYETNLLFGFLPKFHSSNAKMTMTLKQNYIPWRIYTSLEYLNFEPLSCGIYFNTVFGQEFWGKQPKRYPDKYYPSLSTKVRVNAFVGQRITIIVPHNKRKFIKSLTAFYEVSTCDLYIRAKVVDSKVSIWDILSLSLGMKFQLL